MPKISFFIYIELKKIRRSEIFFKFNNYFFSASTPTTDRLDDGMPVTHFEDFKYRYSKLYLNYEQIQIAVYW